MADCEQCAALQRQNDLLANDRDGYVQLLTDDNNKLRAEVEKLKADIGYADKHAAKVEGLLWGTAQENEKLRAALKKINVGDGWAALIARATLERKQ